MDNHEIKIDIAGIEGARRVSIQGEAGTFIPDGKANVYVGKKGVYITFDAIGRRTPAEDGQTHFVKEHIPTEVYTSLSQDERRAIPIIGSVKPYRRNDSAMAPVAVSVDDDMPEDF